VSDVIALHQLVPAGENLSPSVERRKIHSLELIQILLVGYVFGVSFKK
jgi:hypothetical protein